jgi:hypothetical protein
MPGFLTQILSFVSSPVASAQTTAEPSVMRPPIDMPWPKIADQVGFLFYAVLIILCARYL